ncbi:hypothetical protein BTVI_129578 [Pitangus sulphuratus]|nr:hypothetical protein BTVI_129578 [Pitangus sulphuratus]
MEAEVQGPWIGRVGGLDRGDENRKLCTARLKGILLVLPLLSSREGLRALGSSRCSGSSYPAQPYSTSIFFPSHLLNPITPRLASGSDAPAHFLCLLDSLPRREIALDDVKKPEQSRRNWVQAEGIVLVNPPAHSTLSIYCYVCAAAMGFPAGEDAMDVALGFQRPMAMPKSR